MSAGASGFDLVTVGRIGVDLYPREAGRPLAGVETFARSLGGSPTNVAVAAARLGLNTAVVTKVGADPFGEYARGALRGFGVDDRWVGTDMALRTPITFCALHPPDDFPLLFYREPAAPDAMLTDADLPDEAVLGAGILWSSGGGLAAEPARSATLAALRRRRDADPGAISIHDLDHRPSFWAERDDPGRWAREASSCATVVVGNLDEVEMAVGCRDPRRAAQLIRDLGADTAIVKRGGEGVYASGPFGELDLAPVRLDVVNGLGAGDAFGGALSFGISAGFGMDRSLRAANAAGALVASRLACADAMPSLGEVEHLLAASGQEPA